MNNTHLLKARTVMVCKSYISTETCCIQIKHQQKNLHYITFLLLATKGARITQKLENYSKSAPNRSRHSCFNEMQISLLKFSKTLILGSKKSLDHVCEKTSLVLHIHLYKFEHIVKDKYIYT